MKYSGPVYGTVQIAEILGEEVALAKTVSARDLTHEHMTMVEIVAEEICMMIDSRVEGQGGNTYVQK